MSKLEEVKRIVTIPKYFYNIIVPNLADYYSDYTVDFDLSHVVKCPLHDEATPSCRYYDETNTFYCFGCGKGGDIITLHREYTKVATGHIPSLDSAVDFLYDFFVQGNENVKAAKKRTKLVKEEILSTEVDIARFSSYVTKLEEQLGIDPYLPIDKKKKLWKTLDNLIVLVEKNKVSAIEAMDHIKYEVMQVV